MSPGGSRSLELVPSCGVGSSPALGCWYIGVFWGLFVFCFFLAIKDLPILGASKGWSVVLEATSGRATAPDARPVAGLGRAGAVVATGEIKREEKEDEENASVADHSEEEKKELKGTRTRTRCQPAPPQLPPQDAAHTHTHACRVCARVAGHA